MGQPGTRRYFNTLKVQRDSALNELRKLPGFEHHEQPDWLTGCLGNPFSGIWFVGETPSLGQVKKAYKGERKPTIDTQWCISSADKLLRDALVDAGLKVGPWDSPGGWRCYLTDVVKSAHPSEQWNRTPKDKRRMIAEIWSGVLRWELSQSHPVVVVAMGKKAEGLLRYLQARKMLPSREIELVTHYAYVAFRPCGRLPPMDEERVKKYRLEIAEIADAFRQMT